MTSTGRKSEGKGALSGYLILDLTHHLAGPWCTMLLGDMGAEVVKVEPMEGDAARNYPPFLESGDGAPFLTTNRNKRSIAIDLRKPEGRELLHKLAARASVFVQNFRPGVAERLGVSYDKLSAINPKIVYCNISGYGQTGPRAEERGRDLVAQAMTGLMSITGHPKEDPAKVGVPLTDIGTGLYATIGILGAMLEAEKSGRGQEIEVSLFETGLSLLLYETAEYFFTGKVPEPVGSGHRLSAPYQAYPASDGYFIACAESKKLWPLFCQILGLPQLLSDPRFETNELRVINVAELEAIVRKVTQTKPADDWIKLMTDAGIASSRVNSVADALDDPQTKARGLVIESEHPRAGKLKQIGSAIRLSRTPTSIRRHAPALSEHAADILGEMGYGKNDVERLKASGVVK